MGEPENKATYVTVFWMLLQPKDKEAYLVPQVPLLVGWCTLDGGGPHVQLLLEHNFSTQEELLEAHTMKAEVEQTISAYLMT